jgi:ferredoxin--NADP+ reductase
VDDRVRGTGEEEVIDVGLVVRAIGYAAEPVPGLPFDAATGTVPNDGGRVLDGGARVPGAYVTGWIKRGPTGVIGTNKGDAHETVEALLEDLDALPRADRDVAGLLARHGIEPVDWTAWLRLDAEELRRGGLRGTDRVKVAELAEMIAAARAADAALDPAFSRG